MEKMDFINLITKQFLPGAILFALISMGIYFTVKEKIYRYPAQGWLLEKDHPITEEMRNIIVTDGKYVDTMYTPKWNRLGKPVWSYDEKVITHWQPLPEPPKGEFKLIKGE